VRTTSVAVTITRLEMEEIKINASLPHSLLAPVCMFESLVEVTLRCSVACSKVSSRCDLHWYDHRSLTTSDAAAARADGDNDREPCRSMMCRRQPVMAATINDHQMKKRKLDLYSAPL